MTRSPEPSTPRSPLRPPLSLMQVVALVGVLVGLLVILDFNQRLAAAQRLQEARQQVAAEVAVLETEQAVLLTQVAYATTDAAVVEWAHEQGKHVQAGEVLVVPLLPTPLPTAPVAAAAPPVPAPVWALWWGLFFDRPLSATP